MAREHHAHARPRSSRLESTILICGLLGAVLSGVAAWRAVGPFGDGPFGAGFRRIAGPETGRSILVHEFRAGAERIRTVVDERTGRISDVHVAAAGAPGARIAFEAEGGVRVERDLDADGVTDRWEYYADPRHVAQRPARKVGLSLAGDGVVDAWAFYDAAGELERMEVSTGRSGVVDRWEHYRDGLLVAVESDTDGDGRADHRAAYVNGILATGAAESDAVGPARRPAAAGAPR